ncbi:MAG TPA: twin-arginine translocation signal domain-containing protein [Capsulimonadaceae bacterium]|jgi:hypothetical protein
MAMDGLNASRRQFLKEAACIAGAVSIAGMASESEAATVLSAKSLSMGFVNGDSVTELCEHTPCGDLISTAANVMIAGRPHGYSHLRAVNALFPIDIDGAHKLIPYFAWSATGQSASFVMPFHPAHGLQLTVAAQNHSLCRLDTPAQSGNKLRAGTHIVALAHDVLWPALHFDNQSQTLLRRTISGFKPVRFDYIVVTVARA